GDAANGGLLAPVTGLVGGLLGGVTASVEVGASGNPSMARQVYSPPSPRCSMTCWAALNKRQEGTYPAPALAPEEHPIMI
uniref:PPE-SVP domain-containing protein n=1 Tax=Steinernema glaseri TaxID=37863 RepID=A0A1I8AKU9_9BILA